MKKLFSIFFLFVIVKILDAQQTPQYSQFMLNSYGLNPAVGGTEKGWNIVLGRRTQWRGFDRAPETNFVSFTKDLGKKNYRTYWHGIGGCIEYDKYGAFESKTYNASYAIHLKLDRKHFLSFGFSIGSKEVSHSTILYDPSGTDPARSLRIAKIVLFPYIVPGIYYYTSKISISVSARNLYKNTLEQGSRKMGTPSKLNLTPYITISRKIVSYNYDFVFVPSVHIQSAITNLPWLHFNYMVYYRKRIGFGLTYRMHDAVAAMLQIRFLNNVVVGFSYDYTISRFRSAHANSTEFIMGYTPMMQNDYYPTRNSVAECPKFEF